MSEPQPALRPIVTPLVAGLLVFDMVGYLAVLPLLSTLQGEMGLSEVQLGLLIGALAFGSLVFALPVGALADRIGPRKVTLGGGLIAGATFFLFWLAPTFWWMVIARVLQGAASSGIWVGGPTWVGVGTGADRSKRVSRVTGIGMLGSIGGAAFGGWLALPDDLLRSYLYLAILLATLSVVGVVSTRSLSGRGFIRSPRLTDSIVVWRSPLFLTGALLVVVASLTGAGQSVVLTLGLGDRGLDERSLGLLFSIGGIGLGIAQTTAYRLRRRAAPLRLTALVAIGLSASVALAVAWPTVPGFTASLLLQPAVAGLAYGLSLSFLADGSEEAAGSVTVGIAFWTILWAVGAAGGSPLAGWILERSSEGTTLAAITAIGLVVGLGLLAIGRSQLRFTNPPPDRSLRKDIP